MIVWHDVKEELPKPGERVLVSDGKFVGEVYMKKSGKWERYGCALDVLLGNFIAPKYWAEMPKGPEDK